MTALVITSPCFAVPIYNVENANAITKVDSVKGSQKAPDFQINAKDYISPKGEPVPYINKDGRTMVPIRFLADSLGYKDEQITWDNQERVATIIRDTKHIVIKIGDRRLSINEFRNGILIKNSISTMDTEAEMSDGRVFVPVRFIAEALGAKVEWDSKSGKIFLLTSMSNNLARYFRLNIILPASIQVSSVAYTLDSLYIYPAASQEFTDYITTHNITIPNDVKYLILTSFTVHDETKSSKMNYSNGGENSPWYLSVSGRDIITPEGPGTPLNMHENGTEYGYASNKSQIYFSKSDSINGLVFYLHVGSITKQLDLVRNP